MALATHVPHSRSRIFGALSPFLPTRCAPRFTSQLTAIAHSAVRASLRAGGRLAPSDWTDHRTPGAKRDAVAMATTDELGRTMLTSMCDEMVNAKKRELRVRISIAS